LSLEAEREIARIKGTVIEMAAPTEADRMKVSKAVEVIAKRVEQESKARNLNVRVEVEGSVAKDTWIAADRDIDVFIIFPHGTKKEGVKELGLELAKAGAGNSWKLGFAEHPYVEAEVEGCTADIVPSSEMHQGDSVITSVDRTPLHTRFITGKLDSTEKRNEVRVLKQFMKGIEVYGAELKVGGFSGYLCELLIVNYGSFEGVLRAAAQWRERTVIDICPACSEKPAEEAFSAHLVIVDPVDSGRNAAAAVTVQSYSTFISAARWFLKRPSIEFFLPPEERPKPLELIDSIKRKGTAIVVITTGCPNIPSDILWGEIHKSLRRVARMLEESGFTVMDTAAWSDESDRIALLIEADSKKIRKGRLHAGPKAWFMDEEEHFLGKYLCDSRVLAGPYMNGDRWYVELERDCTDLKDLIDRKMPELELSEDVAEEVGKGFCVYEGKDLEELFEDPGLGKAIAKFVRKKPPWLK